MVGRTISHYRIAEKLGEGAMGVVYKAEDTQLRRTVALKFLPRETLDEEAVKERLIREAQAVASLDHPNICAVHGIHQEEGETFIAMAYIDGPSLAEKIKDRPLPLDDAIPLAMQIAEGLQEAHEQGVVHRDIKPRNILLTAKGQAKILDFGLASLSGRSKLTKAGTSMGTPAYMSPEQLDGREVDRRTDIWSLGCVLYEMLTQVTPFDAEYEQAISYGILNEEPEPVTALRSGLPTEIDRLISKALAKSPAERYQHVDDLLTDLRVLQQHKGERKKSSGRSLTLPETHQAHALVALPAGSIIVQRTRHYQLIGAAAAVLLALLVVLWLYVSAVPQSSLPVAASVGLPNGRMPQSMVFSPDGASLAASVYGSPDDPRRLLRVRSLDSNQWREIPGTEEAEYPFWSPDGTQIGFFADGKLKRISLAGGPALPIADASQGRGGSWGPDGTIVFAPTPFGQLNRVLESGGEITRVTEADEGESPSHRFPQLLPDGRHFVYLSTDLSSSTLKPEARGVFIGSLDGGKPQRLLADESYVWFAPAQPGDDQGFLLFVRDNVLMAQPFDARRLEFKGAAVGLSAEPIVENPNNYYRFTASAAGSLAYFVRPPLPRRESQLVWLDRSREVERTKLFAHFMGPAPRLSPDEQRVAYAAIERDNIDVWVYDLGQETRTRLSSDPEPDTSPVWSADGRNVVFKSAANSGLVARSSDGSAASMDFSTVQARRPTDWSRDGRFLLYDRQGEASNDIAFLEFNSDGTWESREFLASPSQELAARISPNGRHVAYVSNESGRAEVYVQPFPEGGQRTTVSRGGGSAPAWNPDGKELFYLSASREWISVQVSTEGPFSMKDSSSLGEIGSMVSSGDMSLDSQRYLVYIPVEAENEGAQSPAPSRPNRSLRLLQNWQQKYFPDQ